MTEQNNFRSSVIYDINSAPSAEAEDLTSEEVSAAAEESQPWVPEDRVVTALLRQGIVAHEEVQKAKERQDDQEGTLWRILADLGSVDYETIYREAARIYAFPQADLSRNPGAEFLQTAMSSFSEETQDQLLEFGIVPFAYEEDPLYRKPRLIFVSHDPMRMAVQELMRDLDIDAYELKYAPRSAVNNLVETAFPKRNEYLERLSGKDNSYDLGVAVEEDESLLDDEALEAEINSSTLINLFEATLVEAVRQGVSDIHVFPKGPRETQIHFRVDGRLKLWYTEDRMHPEAFLAVVKDNSDGIDRFERDKAQDGFIQRTIDGTTIRFRVSLLPLASGQKGLYAESIVIRVLDDRNIITDLGKLGLLEGARAKMEKAIRQPHGLVILTGPTGSGKSTTLVAALHQVLTPEVNVLTVEDPVEYIIKGARQIKLSHKLNLEGALRAILRHDPDIVMVGEMRDQSTAELAVKLANTGHLTFSTLHTNDAPSAISRLYKMGVEPFLLAYAINLVVAQRLIRTLCTRCKTIDRDPDQMLLQELGFTDEEVNNRQFYKAGDDKDCPKCKGIGYKGRRAISEALYFTKAIRHLIVGSGDDIDETALRETALAEGLMTLQASAREVAKQGDTSIEEVLRVAPTSE